MKLLLYDHTQNKVIVMEAHEVELWFHNGDCIQVDKYMFIHKLDIFKMKSFDIIDDNSFMNDLSNMKGLNISKSCMVILKQCKISTSINSTEVHCEKEVNQRSIYSYIRCDNLNDKNANQLIDMINDLDSGIKLNLFIFANRLRSDKSMQLIFESLIGRQLI